MDFTNRGTAPQQPAVHQNPQFSATPPANAKKTGRKNQNIFTKWATTIVGVVITVLIIAVVLAVSFSQPRSQAEYVYANKLQAVFLNTGQVYFGNITSINQQYLVLGNIFYLQTNSSGSTATTSTSSNNVSLVKLGCELHAPYDQMVINMNQVTFWENLQSTGQVAKAVVQYQKQYPNGQTCSANNSTGSVQNVPASSSSTSNSTNPTIKKP